MFSHQKSYLNLRHLKLDGVKQLVKNAVHYKVTKPCCHISFRDALQMPITLLALNLTFVLCFVRCINRCYKKVLEMLMLHCCVKYSTFNNVDFWNRSAKLTSNYFFIEFFLAVNKIEANGGGAKCFFSSASNAPDSKIDSKFVAVYKKIVM